MKLLTSEFGWQSEEVPEFKKVTGDALACVLFFIFDSVDHPFVVPAREVGMLVVVFQNHGAPVSCTGPGLLGSSASELVAAG